MHRIALWPAWPCGEICDAPAADVQPRKVTDYGRNEVVNDFGICIRDARRANAYRAFGDEVAKKSNHFMR